MCFGVVTWHGNFKRNHTQFGKYIVGTALVNKQAHHQWFVSMCTFYNSYVRTRDRTLWSQKSGQCLNHKGHPCKRTIEYRLMMLYGRWLTSRRPGLDCSRATDHISKGNGLGGNVSESIENCDTIIEGQGDSVVSILTHNAGKPLRPSQVISGPDSEFNQGIIATEIGQAGGQASGELLGDTDNIESGAEAESTRTCGCDGPLIGPSLRRVSAHGSC